MKANEFHSLSDAELSKKLKELKSELFNLRFQQATGQLTNTARMRTVKKTIARIKTVMAEREHSVQD